MFKPLVRNMGYLTCDGIKEYRCYLERDNEICHDTIIRELGNDETEARFDAIMRDIAKNI